MKRKMGKLICLSLTAALTLSSMPFTAIASSVETGLIQTQNEAAEDKTVSPFVVNGTGYNTLAEAIEKAGEHDTIEIYGQSNITDSDLTNLAGLKSNITIKNGGSVALSTSAYGGIVTLKYSNTITVEAGGSLSLPGSLSGYEEWFGGKSARMYIEKGSISVSGIEKLEDSDTDQRVKWELSEDAVVTIPSGKRCFLQMSDTSFLNRGVNLVIPEGAQLNVLGVLRGVSGSKDDSNKNVNSIININGTLNCENGRLSLSGSSTNVNGKLIIGDLGITKDSGLNTTDQQTDAKITLLAGGTVQISKNSAWKNNAEAGIIVDGNSKSSYTDYLGNTVYGVLPSGQIGDAVANVSGKGLYTSISDALSAADSGDTITLAADVKIDESVTNTLKHGVTLVIPAGRKLTIDKTGASIAASWQGALKVEAGGTAEIPDSTGDLCSWIGADDSARLKIESGYLIYDFSIKQMKINGNAEVPEDNTAYLHLMTGVPVTGVIAEGAKLTVKGTFKVVSGSMLNVKGTLDVKSSIVINGEVNVKETGTFNLPLMSKEEMDSTNAGAGLGMDGPINISGGAVVNYASTPVLGSTDGYITLDKGAEAVLSFANANGTVSSENPCIGITLKSGQAAVNGAGGVLKALLVAKDGNIPFNIKINSKATATVPENVTLALVNGSSLNVETGGTFDVLGTLEERSDASVIGKVNLSGTAYIFSGEGNTGSTGTYVVKGNGVVYAGENTGITVQNEIGETITLIKLSTPKEYNSISKGVKGTFNYSTQGETVSITTSGGQTTYYSTLKEALENANSGDKVTLLDNVTVSAVQDSAAVGEGVTLVVPNGKTLKVEMAAVSPFLSSQGKVQIEAGGEVVLPTSGSDTEAWIGDETARVNLTEGYVLFDFDTKTVTLTENSKASIPQGKIYYLHLTDGMPLNSIVESGAEFTVNGIYKAVRGSNIEVKSGGTFTVAKDGIYEDRTELTTGNVNVAGTSYIFDTEGLGNFVITGSGTVYGVDDISDNISSGTDGYEVVKERVNVTYPKDSTYDTDFTNKFTIGTVKEETVEVEVVDENGNDVTAPVEGQTLKAVVKVDGTETTDGVSYKWYYSDEAETELATTAEYTVVSEGVGKTLCVDITYSGETTKTTIGEITAEEPETTAYKVTVKADKGTVTAEDFMQNEDGTYIVEEGKDFVFTVTPNNGYEVAKVEAKGEEVTAIDGKYIINITEDTIINVTFTEFEEPITTYTITALAEEGGTISPNGEFEAAEGESVTFIITANEGYQIADVIVDGISKGALSEYTFENVKDNATIKAIFSKIEEEPEPGDETEALTIELSTDKAYIFEGEKLDLKGFITNYKDFTAGFGYKSENENIATVTEDGVVTGIKQGNTGIIISAKESDTYFTTTTNAVLSLTINAKSSGDDKDSSSSSSGGGGSSHSYDGKIEKEDTNNGSFSVDYSKADEGDKITITVKPDEGYVVDEVIVRDENGNKLDVKKGLSSDKYIFEMPDGDVYVEVTFIEEKEEKSEEPIEEISENEYSQVPVQMHFSDVNAEDWFYNAVEYVYKNGLMSGTSETCFSPEENTTRGMIAAILYRLEGSPYVGEVAAFADVPQNEYYSNAVAWGAANGIISGYDSSTFAPNDNITREQMAAILYRYAQYKGMNTALKGDLNIFTDKADISEYALEAMSWAVGEGLISGMGDGSLVPQGYATRAQIASILMRFAG